MEIGGSLKKPGFSINEILNEESTIIDSTKTQNLNNNNNFDSEINSENFYENYEKYLNDNGMSMKNFSEMNLTNENFYPQVAYYYHHQHHPHPHHQHSSSFIDTPTAVLSSNGMLPIYIDKCGNPINAGYPLTLPNPYTTSSPFHPFFIPTSNFGNTKRKGGQIRFTTQQTKSLETQFNNNQYLSAHDRKQLAIKLNLSDRQVKTWFQNRRAKWRRSNNIIEGSESRYHPNQVQNQYTYNKNNIKLNCIENINKDKD